MSQDDTGWVKYGLDLAPCLDQLRNKMHGATHDCGFRVKTVCLPPISCGLLPTRQSLPLPHAQPLSLLMTEQVDSNEASSPSAGAQSSAFLQRPATKLR